MPTIRNARFWVWHRGGWVKLTLTPHTVLHHTHGGPTDEGSSWEADKWTHTGDGVEWEWNSWWRDCDGTTEDGGELFAPLDRLAAEETLSGTMIPDWSKIGRGYHRDQIAEDAGY
jgi:hypothetical protein